MTVRRRRTATVGGRWADEPPGLDGVRAVDAPGIPRVASLDDDVRGVLDRVVIGPVDELC